MPTYTITSANFALTAQQEAEIARSITRSHHESTGAPNLLCSGHLREDRERQALYWRRGLYDTSPLCAWADPRRPQRGR
jgi:hypothetical protein